MTRLVLASRSAARHRMLEAAGVPFEAAEARVDEEGLKAKLSGLGGPELALALAEAKALSLEADALVLGSDQVLERADGSLVGKAGSRDELAEQLRSLSGRTHRLHSAAAVAQGGTVIWRGSETAAMSVRPLSDAFVHAYLDSEYDEVRWSVGGYHVEGRGAQLFERIEGSHFAVLGMPLLPLLSFLREQGIVAS